MRQRRARTTRESSSRRCTRRRPRTRSRSTRCASTEATATRASSRWSATIGTRPAWLRARPPTPPTAPRSPANSRDDPSPARRSPRHYRLAVRCRPVRNAGAGGPRRRGHQDRGPGGRGRHCPIRAPVPRRARLALLPVVQSRQERDMILEVTHPRFGVLREVASPIKTAGAVTAPTPAPALGEHTDQLLRELLHYPPERIAALRAAGVLGDV